MAGRRSASQELPDTLIEIDDFDARYRDWAREMLRRTWGSTRVVSRGQIREAIDLPGYVALIERQPAGLATYMITEDECELTTINSLDPGIGVGSALLQAVKEAAQQAHCRRLWLITTNDNMNALRFYQRRGFSLAALHRNALDASRRLKPEIPLIGVDGIPLRDEIELELILVDDRQSGGARQEPY
ncbi:MAG: GNAT family N-acetyltransferase [Chloroflexota bacterium]|nr:MAG: GNAT family N-acetyltransferase [Chloroflexota bacterium]